MQWFDMISNAFVYNKHDDVLKSEIVFKNEFIILI